MLKVSRFTFRQQCIVEAAFQRGPVYPSANKDNFLSAVAPGFNPIVF